MNRELEQFFTSPDVSNLIAAKLSGFQPKTVVDVGAGEGALLKAMRQRWKKARLLGIDIDPAFKAQDPDIERILANGLDHALPAFLKQAYGNIDLAVSNPPYMAIRGSKQTELILKEAGLLGAIGKSENYPAEVVFLAQNLRILQPNGGLAIIIPSGIVNNERWARLRGLLCKYHRVETVIELPEHSFKYTEAKTFVIILKKGGKTNTVRLYRAGPEGGLSRHKIITAEDAARRMDWAYYAQDGIPAVRTNTAFTLRELGAHIFRGQLSAAKARELNTKIFHSSDMPTEPTEVKLGYMMLTAREQHEIRTGDILISRVGSRCLGRRCYVKSGTAVVSDSVYVIRLDKKYRKYVWACLSTTQTMENINKLARGVCAKYITKDQLLDLPLY